MSEAAQSKKRKLDEPVQVTVSDLHLPADVPLPELEISEPPEFIGASAVNKVYALLLPEYRQATDFTDHRVAPMSLTRFSRGGKTRMLTEVGRKLKEEGLSPIYIGFCDQTALKRREGTTTRPLLMRLAWAAAKDELKEKVAKAAGEDVADLYFDHFASHANVDQETVDAWLSSHPCVLLIDELNQFVRPERDSSEYQELGKYLKSTFLLRKNRYFVFTTHVAATSSSLNDFLASDSNRPVLQPQLPVIDEQDLSHVRSLLRAKPGEVCWAGRSPGLICDWRHTKEPLDAKVQLLWGSPAANEPDAAVNLLRCVLTTAVNGNQPSCDTVKEWSKLLDVFKEGERQQSEGTKAEEESSSRQQKGPVLHVWPACYLSGVFKSLSLYPLERRLGVHVRQGLNVIAHNLGRLISIHESGKEWEGSCAAAVLLRLIQSDMLLKGQGSQGLPAMPTELTDLLPEVVVQQPGCQFGGHISSGTWSSTDDILGSALEETGWLSTHLEWHTQLKTGHAAFVLQGHSFPTFDFFIAVTMDGRLQEIWCYQCTKRGTVLPQPDSRYPDKDKIDLCAARRELSFGHPQSSTIVQVCVWLRGAAGGRTRPSQAMTRRERDTGITWIVPSLNEQEVLFGTSLKYTCPSYFLTGSGSD
ncbi:unnamed protein product [Vitrella brassicaformis CCMP3155]|uniref:Uncharacterized protein n=1 Tax=Vitrella brassicaformis (strain CCMP3155) TaxID=1169540 RepID=A0A0G4EQI3_VITBC|nr:unnamed protein product [Vitrella brassicaformis CCMP3155]|eukprot:CEM00199.1 unnamed protein product [Vitrella brassicaformis CCMP3155]